MRSFYSHIRMGLSVLGLLLLSATASATHIRAGEITAKRVDAQSLTYEITLRLYSDRNSQINAGSNGSLSFGDGTIRTLVNTGDPESPDYGPRTAISADTWMYEYKVMHTYASAGAYKISYQELNRNPGVLNMENSGNMPFYTESALSIDPLLGANTTPEFKRPPIDYAILGKTYHHQPGAWDEDGDSLSYRMVYPKQGLNTPVENYRFPHQTFPAGDPRNGPSEGEETPLFIINPISGDIIWDSPGAAGEYNIAFQVVEWRKSKGKYYQLGYVTRDLQILVAATDDSAVPALTFPLSSGFMSPPAGEPLRWTITATAPTAEDSVVLEIWGDFPMRTNAIISSRMVRAKGEASITIQWTGEENKGQLYQLIARSYYPSTPQLTRNRSTFIYYDPSAPLGIKDPSIASTHVFPNPVTERSFSVKLPETTGHVLRLQLYDLKGRLVSEESRTVVNWEYPVQLQEETKKGLYLLMLHYKDKVYRDKLIVQ